MKCGIEIMPLVRFIAPSYPDVNIFTRAASRVAPLGLVSVATAASKLWGFRVEIIDENNYHGPRDERGLPDHDRLQKNNPASVIGMYCGLSSTMDRAYELSEFYRKKKTFNIAGGWHAHYCSEEVLEKGFDVVVHGDGDIAIREILTAWKNSQQLFTVPGVSFWFFGNIVNNPPSMLELPDLSALP